MLVAKINPPAKRIVQKSAFSTEEFIGEYMVAKCQRLVIGPVQGSFNDNIEFEVKFGNIKYEKNLDGSQGQALFDKIYVQKVMFKSNEMSNWGTDDSIVYTLIAQKLGFTIVSTQQIDIPYTI